MIRSILLVLLFFVGYQFGMHMHPYEQCTRKGFVGPVDIGECIWLLTEQEGLR